MAKTKSVCRCRNRKSDKIETTERIPSLFSEESPDLEFVTINWNVRLEAASGKDIFLPANTKTGDIKLKRRTKCHRK